MTKILFLIHDLGQGGAEKVLVNLVNNMDRSKFDISVTVLFGGGVNEQFLKPDIHFHAVFPKEVPGNSHLMKLLSPRQLHKLCVKEHYDVEVSYLEGPSARVISGCQDPATRLFSWIHCTMRSRKELAGGFRCWKEAQACYERYDGHVFVSDGVGQAFLSFCPVSGKSYVLYNTNESEQILTKAQESVDDAFGCGGIRLCGTGKLIPVKGFDRLLRIHKRLRGAGYPVYTCILGEGEMRTGLERFIQENALEESVSLLGYQTNPYKFVAKCDLFVCSSYAEGFSTAATEALIMGIPVCTVDVSGMKEMLGQNNEYGVVVHNDEDSLYAGIKHLLDDSVLLAHYKKMAFLRGKAFSTAETVKAVEKVLLQES